MDRQMWEILRNLATILAVFVGCIGLIMTVYTIQINLRTLQLRVFWDIFQEIRKLDREYIELDFAGINNVVRQINALSEAPPKETRSTPLVDPDMTKKMAWSSTYFNTIEYLCFVINHNLVKDKELRKFFFTDALPAWRKTYEEHQQKHYITDDGTLFAEFRKAYKQHLEQ